MERCPKCGSGGALVNGVEYYAAKNRGFVVDFVASLFARNHGILVAKEVDENLTENTHKEYKCPQCGCVWTKD